MGNICMTVSNQSITTVGLKRSQMTERNKQIKLHTIGYSVYYTLVDNDCD